MHEPARTRRSLAAPNLSDALTIVADGSVPTRGAAKAAVGFGLKGRDAAAEALEAAAGPCVWGRPAPVKEWSQRRRTVCSSSSALSFLSGEIFG